MQELSLDYFVQLLINIRYKPGSFWHTSLIENRNWGCRDLRSAWKVIFDTMKVFLLFVGCTVLFYFGLKWLDENYEGYHQYDVPSGGAVKVFNPSGTPVNDAPTSDSLSSRFFQFIRDGE
nr:YqzK family protein [Pullulanibacillus pueri]